MAYINNKSQILALLKGDPGITPHIGENSNWWIGDKDTGVRAEGRGEPGITPHIENCTWWIGDEDTGLQALPPYIGNNGNWWWSDYDQGIRAVGKDGCTPYIGENGNWWIDGHDQRIRAVGKDGVDGKDGKDGVTPHVGENLTWWIGDEDTGMYVEGKDGKDGEDGSTPYVGANGNWWIGDRDTGELANAEEALTRLLSGGHEKGDACAEVGYEDSAQGYPIRHNFTVGKGYYIGNKYFIAQECYEREDGSIVGAPPNGLKFNQDGQTFKIVWHWDDINFRYDVSVDADSVGMVFTFYKAQPLNVGGTIQRSLHSAEWDSASRSSNIYNYKAFKYDITNAHTDVDFDVRLGTSDGVFFRYPCNLQRPFNGESRIIFRTPRLIFEDESKKNLVTYFRAHEKPVLVRGTLFDVILAAEGEIFDSMLVEGESYFIEGTKFTATDVGYYFAPTGTRFTGQDGRVYETQGCRIVATDGQPVPDELDIRIFNAKASDTEREIWFEIKTGSSTSMPAECHLNLTTKGGSVADVDLVIKDYEPYVRTEGYDSLTINSADWANKTTNLNISSRAAAPYSTASGNDSRAEGEAGDVGGINNVGKGKASIVRGESITERGLYNAVFGNKHEFLGTAQNAQSNLVGGGANKIKEKASYNLVAGNGNTVGGSSNVVGGGGGGSEVTGGYDLAVGYAQHVSGEGSGNVGHYNRITHKQAQTFGRYLATGRNYQARFGVGAERDADGNGKDTSSMLVVSNGAENGSSGRDIFAVSNAYSGDATSGYYAKASKPNDALTLGYFNSKLKQEIIDAVIAAIQASGNGTT